MTTRISHVIKAIIFGPFGNDSPDRLKGQPEFLSCQLLPAQEFRVTSAITRHPRAINLLDCILDQPGLPAVINRLDAGVLLRLIRYVGLEDSGPIVSQITATQLETVFDDDLWLSRSPGRAEFFNAARFGIWLEILMENGPAFAAAKIMKIDEDLLALGICRLVRVESIHTMEMHREDNWQEYPKSIPGESLTQVISDYRVISKDDSSWDAVLGLLLHLDEMENDTLVRLLRRCSRISETSEDDHGGLLKTLSEDEILEEDVAAERDSRRESQGFVIPSSAAAFLDQSRSTSLNRIVSEKSMPHSARFYIKSAEADDVSEKKRRSLGGETPEPAQKEMAVFLDTLKEAGVLSPPSQAKLWYDGPDVADSQFPITRAMRIIKELDPDLYARRIMELSYLSNTLISGCGYRGREFNPREAGEAALSVCNLGSEYLFEMDTTPRKYRSFSESLPTRLKTTHLVRLFRIGWKILFDSVILPTARSVLSFLDQLRSEIADPEQKKEIAATLLVLRAAISSGRPWAFQEEGDYLQVFLDGETTETLGALIREYPTFSETLCKKGGHHLSPFISSHAHIRTLRHFLKDVFPE